MKILEVETVCLLMKNIFAIFRRQQLDWIMHGSMSGTISRIIEEQRLRKEMIKPAGIELCMSLLQLS
ncbi:hypothetical protein AQUCO_00100528v1 [Aquilegia coerulea]|uniref:Uncharacterized protein n=1 Tax=Aquilegia coerulea TaxID=218851 RepID=A0A2G5FAP1_AQUCA|nr:hypothetical protein AQUCO_00100528v1 [Aquilegia coerulea]